MNIKSLLLGSAAALAAVSGAQAADAIVAAEPEPLEYVRVCDAFGTGYFYIPGTETCLKVGGRVRFDVNVGDAYSAGPYTNGTNTLSRAELNIDTASDTEYGALKTQFVGRWNNRMLGLRTGFGSDTQNNSQGVSVVAANISIGGFLVGLADSQYTAFTGYAGDIISDDVVSYGRFELNQVTYTYDPGNGFSAVISLEDNNDDSTLGLGNNDYAPNVVGGVGYSAGGFGFKIVGGYDTVFEEGGVKARLDATLGTVEAFVMAGYNPGNFSNAYAPWGGDFAVWAGIGVPVNETLKANVQVAYDDAKTLAVAANVKWTGIPGLLIEPEVEYTDFDGNDVWAGVLRVERKF